MYRVKQNASKWNAGMKPASQLISRPVQFPQVISRLAEFTEMARRTAVQNEVGVRGQYQHHYHKPLQVG